MVFNKMCDVVSSFEYPASKAATPWIENKGVEVTKMLIKRLQDLGRKVSYPLNDLACFYILKAIDLLGMGVPASNKDLFTVSRLIIDDEKDYPVRHERMVYLKKTDYRLPHSGLLEFAVEKDLSGKTLWAGLKNLKEGTILKGTPEEIVFQILWS